jgi:uncharacterized protein involved in response to NO
MTPVTFHSPAPAGAWAQLRTAPHRLMFLAGAVQLVAIMAWWLATLLARLGVLALPALTTPQAWTHAFLAIYGLFPFFVFGFLLTVYPRWMGTAPVPALRYLTLFALLASGMLIHYLGMFSLRAIAALGVAVYLAGWLYGLWVLLGVYRGTPHKSRHELALNVALAAGAAGVALYAIALLADSALAYGASRALGLWLFLALTLFAVSHRMIPFFSQAVLINYPLVRPAWSLPLAGVCLTGHALLEGMGEARFLFLFDLPLAVVALQHTIKWNFRRSFEVRLLAILHLAFAWFGVAMALFAARSIGLLAGVTLYSEYAPLHALTIGFITGMAVAMVSRVTLGHSGRQLWADNLTWYSFLGVNATAVVRIAAEFAPSSAWLWVNALAAASWLVFLGAWVAHYAPIYLRPRADGRPG